MDGKPYKTTEAAYQAAKSLDQDTRELIRKAKSPYAAKKLGQSVKLRPDWEEVKVQVMRGLIRQKFENPFLRPLLTATSDAELIEGNHWHDRFWGVCGGIGQNWLGRLLMEVRDEINTEDSVSSVVTVVSSSNEV